MPYLSTEQKAEGRKRSLEVRQARTFLKEQLKHQLISLEEALQSPVAQKMKVADLLTALPYVAVRRAQAIMQEVGIPAGNTVARCGTRQLAALIERCK